LIVENTIYTTFIKATVSLIEQDMNYKGQTLFITLEEQPAYQSIMNAKVDFLYKTTGIDYN
jgi:hypothetical protein